MKRGQLYLAGLVMAVLIAALAVSVFGAASWTGQILALLDRLRHLGPLGWLIFFGLQTLVALIGFLPASLLGLAAGAVYGVPLGFMLSAAGVLTGAVLAFILTRSAFRPAIARLIEGRARLNQLDRAVSHDGWRLVCLMRVSPVMPFSVTSYALGLTGIKFRCYAIGTLASLPALLLYVVLGTLGAHGLAAQNAGRSPLHLVLIGVGIAATVLLTLRLGQILAKALRMPVTSLD
jgi:uncharacterized membrane protein YdjX (TVP38/TMEM64 family)